MNKFVYTSFCSGGAVGMSTFLPCWRAAESATLNSRPKPGLKPLFFFFFVRVGFLMGVLITTGLG